MVEFKPYTYILYHKPTGFYYYGSSYANSKRKIAHPSQLWNTYFTSSIKVKNLIEDYGVDSFEFEIRKIFTNSIKCRLWEIKVISRLKILHRKNFLNQRNPGGVHTLIHRKNFRPWNYGLSANKDIRCRNKMKGINNRYTEDHKKNLAYKSSSEYKSIESRIKHSNTISGIGNPAYNKIWINDGVVEKRILESDFINFNNFKRGKLKRIYINNGNIEKLILPKDLDIWVNNGFTLGQKNRLRDKSGKFITIT